MYAVRHWLPELPPRPTPSFTGTGHRTRDNAHGPVVGLAIQFFNQRVERYPGLPVVHKEARSLADDAEVSLQLSENFDSLIALVPKWKREVDMIVVNGDLDGGIFRRRGQLNVAVQSPRLLLRNVASLRDLCVEEFRGMQPRIVLHQGSCDLLFEVPRKIFAHLAAIIRIVAAFCLSGLGRP